MSKNTIEFDFKSDEGIFIQYDKSNNDLDLFTITNGEQKPVIEMDEYSLLLHIAILEHILKYYKKCKDATMCAENIRNLMNL